MPVRFFAIKVLPIRSTPHLIRPSSTTRTKMAFAEQATKNLERPRNFSIITSLTKLESTYKRNIKKGKWEAL